MERLLSLKNIYQSFGQQKVLKGINLSNFPEKIYLIKGRSGCGKSVTVNSDTPPQSTFLPLYYTKKLGGSINGKTKIYIQATTRTTHPKLSLQRKDQAFLVSGK